jgi:DNA ligase D-like protein (predicted ligase)
MAASNRHVQFIEPMLLLRTEHLPEGRDWVHELKIDGFRAVAFKSNGKVQLRSRNDKDFSAKYPVIVKALQPMPDETVVDGEIVAFDQSGLPSFSALQNYGSAGGRLYYYMFDVMVVGGEDVMALPLDRRREILAGHVLSQLGEPIRESPVLEASLADLVQSVKAQGLEGLVAKRRDSRYEPGRRSGAWQKMRVNQGQEFVIGGYTLADRTFDALIFGYYEVDRLIYVARTRSGFTPASRDQLLRRFKGLEIDSCPFGNLPEARGGRWGEGLTAEKMKVCRWLQPVLVGQFEFLEWTPDGHLRHTRFVGLRADKKARDIGRESHDHSKD